MNFIEHILEPDRLLLQWRSPDEAVRTRFVVGELFKRGGEVCFRYLVDSPDYIKAKNNGFELYPAFKAKGTSEICSGVLDTFLRRLPPRSRGDFSKYLENYRIRKDASFSDFALLGYTGARLPTDGFSLGNPFESARGEFELLVEITGFRHMSQISADSLSVGMEATFIADSDNEFDSNAIAILIDSVKVGYVPRVLLPSFSQWLNDGNVVAHVERLNGRPGNPIVYLFVRVNYSKAT